MKVLLIKLIAAILIVVTEQTDYCAIDCKSLNHIACHNSKKFSSKCPRVHKIIELDKGKQNLLETLHNGKRNLIAGGKIRKFKGACRMATMEWDDELAYLAKLNVMQCELKHDKCRATKKFEYAGQNLGIVIYTGPHNVTKYITNIVVDWFDENKHCKENYIREYPDSYSGPAIGHFTVMVAERNTNFGCSAALFYDNDKGPFNFLLACNYATTNMVDFPIYETCKKPGSKCAAANPKYKNLCSKKEKYDVNVWMKNGVRYT